mgnify:CR=1 FL=1
MNSKVGAKHTHHLTCLDKTTQIVEESTKHVYVIWSEPYAQDLRLLSMHKAIILTG